MTTVKQKLFNKDYDNRLQFPSEPDVPNVIGNLATATDKEIAAAKEAQQAYSIACTKYDNDCREYKANERKLIEEFKADLASEEELTSHPKAELLFSKAWDLGHSSGLGNVYASYRDLAELLR